MQKDWRQKVDDILQNAQGHPLDIYNTLFQEYIRTSDEPEAVFAYILQKSNMQVGFADGTAANLMPDEEIQKIRYCYGSLLHEVVSVLARENQPEDVFYSRLYQHIFGSDLFPADEKLKAVFLWMLADDMPEIPYFEAKELLKMSNEDYQELLDEMMPQIGKAIHMLNRNFGSKTEEASQLCRIADSIGDKNKQIVYWAAILNLVRRKGQ